MDSGEWGPAMGRTSIEMGETRMFSVSPLSPFLSDSLKEIQKESSHLKARRVFSATILILDFSASRTEKVCVCVYMTLSVPMEAKMKYCVSSSIAFHLFLFEAESFTGV